MTKTFKDKIMNGARKVILPVLIPILFGVGCSNYKKAEYRAGNIDINIINELPYPHADIIFGIPSEQELRYEFMKNRIRNGVYADILELRKINSSETRSFSFVDFKQDGIVDLLIKGYIKFNKNGELGYVEDTLNLNLGRGDESLFKNQEDISRQYQNLVGRIE